MQWKKTKIKYYSNVRKEKALSTIRNSIAVYVITAIIKKIQDFNNE